VNESSLKGRRILVVEDEYMIADAMKRGLEDEGATVVGPAPSVRRAFYLLEATADLDGAVLDMTLGEEKVFPVADALQAKGIPFVFTTGYDPAGVPPGWRHVQRLEKLIEFATIARALSKYRAS
jgi:CheY-like chemotaxis protein